MQVVYSRAHPLPSDASNNPYTTSRNYLIYTHTLLLSENFLYYLATLQGVRTRILAGICNLGTAVRSNKSKICD